MSDSAPPMKSWSHRLGLFVLLLVCGLLIFVFGSPYYSVFPTNQNLTYNIVLSLAFLAATVLLYRTNRLKKYWQVAFAFTVASCANLMQGAGLFNFIITSDSPLPNMAQNKIAQAIPLVATILVLTKAAGSSWESIYLKRGNLRAGLIFGVVSFVLFAVAAVLQTGDSTLWQEGGIASVGWILLFVFANAFMEELWFRGIFLKRLEPFLGMGASILLTSILFGAPHIFAAYISPAESLMFALLVFGLGLAGGYVMHKTDSLWGPMLFHAGYDLLVIVPIAASLS